MVTHRNPHREQPSTYFVQDRHNKEELTRLQIQDQAVTSGMGGVLPEQPDPAIFQRVLDVGCGTGGWLIAAAKAYPNISLLVGVDVSERMIEFARGQAADQQLSDRVQFHPMDALRRLEFPFGYFDLVNQRFGASYLRTWEWPQLLHEFQRVTRPGGVIRITEGDMLAEHPGPTLASLNQLLLQAFYNSGHLFTFDSKGLTSHLVPLLSRYGLQNVQTHTHTLGSRPDTTEGQLLFEDLKHIFRTIVPFLRKWTRVPDDYETIYQQMLSEVQQSDVAAPWSLLTTWGNTPPEIERPIPMSEER